MKVKIEYKIMPFGELAVDLITNLNQLGQEGWILSTVTGGKAILYREV